MSKISKDLKIYTNRIVADIFDNFDDYKSEDKQNVYELLVKMKAINESLEGYDNTNNSWYQKWLEAIKNTV